MSDISEKKSNWPPRSIPISTRLKATQWIKGMRLAITNFGNSQRSRSKKSAVIQAQYLRAGDLFGLPGKFGNPAGITWEAKQVSLFPDRLQVLIHAQSTNSSKEFIRYYPMTKRLEIR